MDTKSLLITGYRHIDLGIFSEKDPRLIIIKAAIRRDLVRYLESGTTWFVLTGQLGFEFWCLEVLEDLRSEGYEFQIASIFMFRNHGEQWNEDNQLKLQRFKQVDFVKYAYPRYENPGQFRDYNQFLLDNTTGCYLFYDSENETNLKYLYHMVLKKEGYNRKTLTFEELNEEAENFSNSE
ncbi:DUF1273 domain-containing protein [Streptococcus suis]|uniref:DUF1273 domain-containing protein n=1 Tax=Streptococcus suis TaxID=1307 RepID=UPI001C9434EA|nr:DUF1273 domain-containing protein [Streptococcus suis]MBY4981830.1 DUF1273 domain-containing protein [Streptococcus suis]MBY4992576.1 DUF1273 domain-containing protein [Streptococcus suis]MBY5007983.1 DUF1273 domain-containing protein [Streptococcus suis]